MEQTKGVVLYGYTHNKQNGGQIPNFPPEKTKIFCEPGDLVCNGTLVLTISHFLYLNDVGAAKDFLVDRVDNYP
jgi:cutinase